MSDDGRVRWEREGSIAVVVLDRPHKLNSITFSMSEQLFEIIAQVNRDDDIRVVVVSGAGDRAFSVGSDVSSLDHYGTNWQMRNRADYGNDYIDAMKACRKPMIAEIDGYAYGGGLEIACVADLRIATPESSFAASEIRLGWHAGSGQTQYLPRLMGYGNALRMLLTGRPISAADALHQGLVQEVVERDRLRATTREIANDIAENAPIAVQLTKHLVRNGMNLPIQTALAWENDLFAYVMKTADSEEGQRAFSERRKARFEGR